MKRRVWALPSVTLLLLLSQTAQTALGGVLYGSSRAGELFTIDEVTGVGTLVCNLPNATNEIEYDNDTGGAFLQLPDGSFTGQAFDIDTCVGGSPVPDGHSFTGLEYVGGLLYGTSIDGPVGPSELRTLDPTTGVSSLVGPTGVGPISGLAYDTSSGVMYGIAGGPGPAALYTINLTTGVASVVGSTGMQAGSLQFGNSGWLFAGGTGANAGELWVIDPSTGAGTLVGSTGFASVTGLTFRTGCGPILIGCKAAGKSLLLLKNNTTDDSKDKLVWKWLKGAATALGEFGDPTSTNNYNLCLYAGTSSASVKIPAGASWQTAGVTGYKFKDPSGTPDGAQKGLLKSGAAGKAKSLVKGKGANLPDSLVPMLPLPVTVQLISDENSACFEAVYILGNVKKNDAKQFKAKAP